MLPLLYIDCNRHTAGDFEFAANFGIPVKQVIRPPDGAGSKQLDRAYCDEGVLFNSGEFTGLSSQQARTKIADLATQNSFGAHQVNYKVKDWLLSRQRYIPCVAFYVPDGNSQVLGRSHSDGVL